MSETIYDDGGLVVDTSVLQDGREALAFKTPGGFEIVLEDDAKALVRALDEWLVIQRLNRDSKGLEVLRAALLEERGSES